MRVLVACEFSGAVRDAFSRRGHQAMSCDLRASETPGLHYCGDIMDVIDGWMPVSYTRECDPSGEGHCRISELDVSSCMCIGPTQDGIEYKETAYGLLGRPIDAPSWDILIAHPPCTHLAISGARWFASKKGQQDEALEFVRKLMEAPIKRIAIENPVSIINSRIRKPDQIIQPWWFGHEARKSTCLWLKNLRKLKPTHVVEQGEIHVTESGKKIPEWYSKLPKSQRQEVRSQTFPGIAEAMATQWG